MEQKQNQIIRIALLVEDNPMIQRVISTQLSSLDYKVTAVDNATSAIQALRNHHYNLIVVDLGLPDKPGDEVIKAARQSNVNQGTPLIVSTAQLSKSDFKIYLELGADAVLIKPYTEKVLEEAIKRCHLKPYYRRKFFYQIKTCIESFEKIMQQPQTQEEFELWLDHFQTLLTQSSHALQEYRQWYEFEKINFYSQNR